MLFFRNNKTPAKETITPDQIAKVDKGVTAFLEGIKELENIDEDERESLVKRGKQIVNKWVSKALEQWSIPD